MTGPTSVSSSDGSPTCSASTRGQEALQEAVVGGSLDVDPLDGDAALAGEGEGVGGELRRGLVEVGVRLDDHGRRVAELERDLLPRRTLAQLPADLRRAGERDQLHALVLDEDVADLGRRTVRTLSQPGGRPASCSSSASSSAESGVWEAGLSTTAQPAASAGAILCATRLSGKLNGEIAPTTPIGRAQRERELADAGLRRVHRHHLAGELPRLDGRERVRRHRAGRLDTRCLHRLAGLGGDRLRHLVVPLAEVAGDADEDLGALVRRQRLGHGLLGRVDRAPGIGRAGLRHAPDDLARVRRPDLDPLAGLDPLSADEQLPFDHRRGHV